MEKHFAAASGLPMRQGLSPEATAELRSAHPNIRWIASEIIEHIRQVHQPFLRGTLRSLDERFVEVAGHSPAGTKPWNALAQRFSKLRDEMLRGLDHEQAVVFPALVQLEGNQAWKNVPPAWRLEFAAVERQHALCLQMLWRLLRVTKDQVAVLPRTEAGRHLTEELTALGDDYEQQLFEIECLLFMQLASPPNGKPR
jgi:iron-sulfur cluster repair protein YtfE (RIC family)